VELPVDDALTLSAANDIAYARYPTTAEVLARTEQADAWVDRGSSWLADRPSLSLRYQSGRWGSDNGLYEYEAGVALLLWSWGGGSAVQLLGETMSLESAVDGISIPAAT
jgi:outer membrane protein TolC